MKNLRHLLMIIVIAVSSYWYAIQPQSQSIASEIDNKIAPNFTLKDENGKQVSLNDYRGKVVVLHFWATWCANCRTELPEINALIKKYTGKNFAFVGVSIDEEGLDAIKVFRKKVKMDFTTLLDPVWEAASKYGTTGVPESYILDKNGKIIEKFLGPVEWTSPEMDKIFKGLIEDTIPDVGFNN